MEFRIGDRVEAIVDHPDGNVDLFIGDTGTICHRLSPGRVGVEWDKAICRGHSCDGFCEYGYGWYVDSTTLKLHKDDSDIDIDDSSFFEIISKE